MKIEIDDKTFEQLVKRAAIWDTEGSLPEISAIEEAVAETVTRAAGITDKHIAEYWRLEREKVA